MDIPLLREVVIIFALSIAVQLACYRVKIPIIVGFLLTGVLAGPHALGFVNNVEDVDILATMGIVMLLFVVGMEFSLKKILNQKRDFLLGGLLQVSLTIAGIAFLAWVCGYTLGQGLAYGFLIALSSTAIVLKAMDQNGMTNTPHGRLTTSILIFQDIVAVPMLLFIPMIGGADTQINMQGAFVALQGFAALIIVAVLAVKLVPKFLYYVTKTRSRELFLLSVLTICFAVAWATSALGLSLALGAFLAGLIVSESEYSNEAVGDVLPFQDIFTSFFFISIGMLLDLHFVLEHPLLVIFYALAIIGLKALFATAATILMGLPLRTAVMTGVALSQIGEFSFVIASAAVAENLMSEPDYQLFLALSVLTMSASPWLIAASPAIFQRLMLLPLPKRIKSGLLASIDIEKQNDLVNHVIIVGFGVVGRHVALSCKKLSIPYIIIEMNPETVMHERVKGEPIHFGDASHTSILEHAYVKNAKVIAVVVNDPVAAFRIVKKARHANNEIYVIARIRYMQDLDQMLQTGANEVVVDEVGATFDVFYSVLNTYDVDSETLRDLADEIFEEWPSQSRSEIREFPR